VTTPDGAVAGRVVRAAGAAGAGGEERAFVLDLRDATDDRLRAVALATGVLWDCCTVAWEPGGG
jgi:hypothetical protein